MSNLPLLNTTFEEIQKKHHFYVDKTDYIYNIIKDGKACVLARPPFFGKSLLMGGLVCAFEGKRELFKGLKIDESDYDFVPRPNVHLNFSNLVARDLDSLKTSLSKHIAYVAGAKGLTLQDKVEPSLGLKDLIAEVYRQNDQYKVAVLIEGYDSPVMKLMLKSQKLATEGWAFLKTFYQTIRLNDLTGLIFFTGQGYLDFGHLKDRPEVVDLSFDPRFATSCGFTEFEFKSRFASRLNWALNKLIRLRLFLPSDTIDDLLKDLELIYGGYTWNGVDMLLNPFSINEFFKTLVFDPYWCKETNRTLLNILAKGPPEVLKILSKEVVLDSISEPHSTKNFSPELLMFQHGHLSWDGQVGQDLKNGLKLYFPNLEVKYSLLPRLLGIPALRLPFHEAHTLGNCFKKAIFASDHLEMETIFRKLNWHSPITNSKNFLDHGKKIIFHLLAISGQSLKPIFLEPFDFALSGHDIDDPEYHGHNVLIDFRFLNNPDQEIEQIKKAEHPAAKLKTAILEKLDPTNHGSNTITLSACLILFGESIDGIKVIFKKL
jgi:hypothetical protein